MKKYCVIKDTSKIISQGKREDLLILAGESTKDSEGNKVECEILTEEEYQARKAVEPVTPPKPSEIEMLRMEQAKTNAELIDLMMMMMGYGGGM